MMTPSSSWLIFGIAFLLTFGILKTLFFSGALVNIALCLLAGYLADAALKAINNALPRHNIQELHNKAVVITGCDSGFGMELAKTLDQQGMKVYAGCLHPDGCGAQSLQEVCSDRLQIVPLDVTKQDDARKAAEFVATTLGDSILWALVNNAGVAVVTEVEWCPVETYQRTLDVNALGPIRVTKAFLPLLRRTRGRVIIVASLAGRYTFPGFSAYSMSKYAAVSFADALRREMKKFGVSVHTVEPTLYKTPIAAEEGIDKELQRLWDQVPGDIQSSYGNAYFLDFQETIRQHLRRAKPNSKIAEVVNDLVDAVIGENPKSRYVPSVVTQIRARILASLPTDLQDLVLCQGQPKTPPAELTLPNGPAPFTKEYLVKRRQSLFRRFMSMPTMEKETLEKLHEAKVQAFKY